MMKTNLQFIISSEHTRLAAINWFLLPHRTISGEINSYFCIELLHYQMFELPQVLQVIGT